MSLRWRYAPAFGSEERFALQFTHPYGFACARLRVGYLRLAPPALLIAQIPNIIANLDSVAMAEVLKTRRIHFILSPAAGVRCSRWQALKAVWLPARDWIRFGANSPVPVSCQAVL